MNKFVSNTLSLAASAAILFGAVSSAETADYSYAGETPDKVIALTFDDGPNTTTTNEILDILEEYDAKATFFLIGNNINDESAVSVKRAYDMGCEIGNHSKSHPTMTDLTEAEIIEEVSYVDEKVFEITGEYPTFFRPPFIAVNDLMYDTIDHTFICGFGCSDYLDTVTAQDRIDAVMSAAKDGLIVLLHDAAGNDMTVEALKTIVPELIEDGYELVTLSELYERQGETPKKGLLYSEVAKYPCSDYSLYKEIFSGEASGDSSWDGWSSTAVLDGAELESLGDTYAIEVDYISANAPVLVLQCWSNGNSLWSPVNAAYYNGERACFMAEDIIKAVEESGLSYTDMDRIAVRPYGGDMTLTGVELLVKNEGTTAQKVNAAEIADFLLGRISAKAEYDVDNDGIIDCFDLVAARKSAEN